MLKLQNVEQLKPILKFINTKLEKKIKKNITVVNDYKKNPDKFNEAVKKKYIERKQQINKFKNTGYKIYAILETLDRRQPLAPAAVANLQTQIDAIILESLNRQRSKPIWKRILPPAYSSTISSNEDRHDESESIRARIRSQIINGATQNT